MADKNIATMVREFMHELFGSRMTNHLEEELMRSRADCETRLDDKERTIADLREQVSQLTSKVDRYELVLLPMASPLGGFFAPKKREPTFQGITEPKAKSWPEIQIEWDLEQEREAAAEKAAKETA